jgi:hypothetical protein
MLKRTKPDEKLEAPAQDDFAASVIKLYEAALKNHTEPCADSSLETRRVGFGLAALRQALDPFLHKHQNDPLRIAAAGGFEALAILDALTSGQDHPIWKHIDGLRSARYRPGAAAPVQQEQYRRAMLVGAALAYQKETGVSMRKATAVVCAGDPSARARRRRPRSVTSRTWSGCSGRPTGDRHFCNAGAENNPPARRWR